MTTARSARTAVTAAALLVLGAGTSRAQERNVDTTFSVRGSARLSMSNQSGNITIHAWSRSQIRVQAESDHARVDINETGTGISVRSSNRGGHGDVDYTISVPRGTAIEIQGMSTDVQMEDVCGSVNVNTLSGDVHIDCVEGSTQVQTISGDITLENLKGSVDVNSTSGDIGMRSVKGQVAAQSVSGDISMDGVESSDITAEVVSGDVSYTGRIQDNGRYKFAAHSGDVTVRTPGAPNVTVSIETFSGDFESDFQIRIGQNQRISKNWEFTLGTGSAHMQLSSFSGTIGLRRSGGSGNSREE